tara:strand:- start:142959 stop:144266 length:1308 start_codon:yes stop_codon:yes gene_type:complete
MRQPVSGFSKKSKEQKIEWLLATYFKDADTVKKIIQQYYTNDDALQQLHDDFIENAITNYFLPFGVAPNFLLNGQLYAIPMVTEESSVVAAASNAAKFWLERGGFTSEVISTVKNGQVHLDYYGDANVLTEFFEATKPKLIASLDALQKNMKRRGGGLLDIEFLDASETLEGYFQLHCTFETLDAMGANFINSCLEQIATTFTTEAQNYKAFTQKKPRVVMSILSNYVPECLVRAEVHCRVEDLTQKEVSGEVFAENFVRAINIAKSETRRAVTHNKGIMNGIDAVVLATGNDFRAVEAGVHAYAAKNGYYGSLTHAQVEDGVFRFWIELPLALGTVGGLTSLHPLAKFALQLLQNPNARELMQLVAAAGLAQNFAAIKSLVTVGIQKGHMKMHLMNILNQLEASSTEKEKALKHFKEISVSHSAVENYIEELRS